MNQGYYKVMPRTVYAVAKSSLVKVIDWEDFGRKVTVGKLLDLILMCACLRLSLSGACRRHDFGFSHETARKAVNANLPDSHDELLEGYLNQLLALVPFDVLKSEFVVAIDEHRTPFYGKKKTTGVTGGVKKHGTKYAYSYATAIIVHHRKRYTVGLIPLFKGDKPHQVVERLVQQMVHRGLKIRGIVLDSAYDSGETLLFLQQKKLFYTVPLRRKGDKKNRRNELWNRPIGEVTQTSWTTEESRKEVTTEIQVWRGPNNQAVRVYAFGGWDEKQARTQLERGRLARRWYRKRFGIETGYRQMNEVKAKTTKKDVIYRLLLIGVALLIRQVWVVLSAELAQTKKAKPTAWLGWTLRELADMILQFIHRKIRRKAPDFEFRFDY